MFLKTKEFFIQYFHAKANDGYHNKTTDFRSYFLTFDNGARLEIMNKPDITEKLRADGYLVVSGPRTTGDGYYESCIVGLEGNQIEITE